jgi:hypothetical protein
MPLYEAVIEESRETVMRGFLNKRNGLAPALRAL